jgi:hypothetical protein
VTVISALKIDVAFFLIFLFVIAVLLLPSDREIPLTNFTNSNLIGYGQIRLDWQNNGTKSLIQAELNHFWQKQKDTENNYLRSILHFIQTRQNYVISKVMPHYAGVLFYASDYPDKPIIIYVINSRINQYLLKFLFLPAVSLSSDYLKKDFQVVYQLEINARKYQVYRFDRYFLMFYHNLCLISDTLIAFNYALADTNRVFPPNLTGMKSLFDSRSDFTFVLDNRDKTCRLAQKFIEARKLSFDSELEMELYRTILQRLKIYSDSIVAIEIKGDIVNGDGMNGRWTVLMRDENSARKFALVIDGLHQLISQELGNRDLLYTVERNISNNQIISEFEIKGLKQLVQKN